MKRDALRRGDRSLAAWMRAFDPQWWLNDTPEIFRADMNALLVELSHASGDDDVRVAGVHAMLAWVERYLGLVSDAFTRTARVVERARATPFWVVPRHRVGVGLEYVASAIAHAETSQLPVPPDAEALLDEFPAQACGVVDLFRSGIACLRGDRAEALRLLERAESEPGMERTRLVVTGARCARGRLLGGSLGRALVSAELERGRMCGHANPERLLESAWPGFRSVS